MHSQAISVLFSDPKILKQHKFPVHVLNMKRDARRAEVQQVPKCGSASALAVPGGRESRVSRELARDTVTDTVTVTVTDTAGSAVTP